MTAALQPCKSPYCECDVGCCTHPGFYDDRHVRKATTSEALKVLKARLSDVLAPAEKRELDTAITTLERSESVQCHTLQLAADAIQGRISALPLGSEAMVEAHKCKGAVLAQIPKAELLTEQDGWMLVRKEPSEAEIDAPRTFLMGLELGIKSVGPMREHLTNCGTDFSMLPEWFKTERDGAHLTKAGKAICIRAFMVAAAKEKVCR